MYILQPIQCILSYWRFVGTFAVFHKLLPFHIQFLSVYQIVRNNNDLRSIQIQESD